MSNKTRYFVVTAGAILAVGLTTGLVASYMGLPVRCSRAPPAPTSSSTSPPTPPSWPTPTSAT